MPLNLIWTLNGNSISSLPFPIAFPGVMGAAQELTLRTSAAEDLTYLNLTGVQFFLDGDADELNTLLYEWPYYGSQPGAIPQPSLNGGIEVSFDNGVTFQRFCRSRFVLPGLGDPADPTTWLTLPSAAIFPSDADGNLGAFATASMLLRYNVPAQANQYQIFDVRLEAAFDVV